MDLICGPGDMTLDDLGLKFTKKGGKNKKRQEKVTVSKLLLVACSLAFFCYLLLFTKNVWDVKLPCPGKEQL